MVTAVVNVASAVGSAATTAANSATGTTSAGNGAGNGRDESEFAQLLDGMDAEVAKSASPVDVVASKPAAPTSEADAGSTALSAEMLAMIAIPVTPVATTVMSAPTAATASQSTDAAATTAGVTAVTTAGVGNVATGSAASGNTTVAGTTNNAGKAKAGNGDSRGTPVAMPGNSATATAQVGTEAGAQVSTQSNVQANTQVNTQAGTEGSAQVIGQAIAGDARASKQSTTKNTVAVNAAATAAAAREATSATQASVKAIPHQDAYQKLAAQAAPMLALVNAQRYEQDGDARIDAAVDTTALSNLPAQSVTNQSVSDAQALDVTTRHHLRSSVGSHPWATELGDKLTMMASKGMQSATLHMSPADLGPVQVRIETNQNQASVWFTAEHAETRSALEQSLPRLREMFNEQGMQLTDAGVFGDRSRQQPGYNTPEQDNASALRFADEEVAASRSSVGGISLSLLDAYA